MECTLGISSIDSMHSQTLIQFTVINFVQLSHFTLIHSSSKYNLSQTLHAANLQVHSTRLQRIIMFAHSA